MALKTQIDAAELDEMPEALREFYVESSEAGKYDLSTDQADRIREFRENNIALTQTVRDRDADLQKAQSELDSAKGEVQKRFEKELLSEGKVEELLDQRTEAMRGSYDERIADLTNKLNDAEQTLDVSIVENQIRDAAIKANAKSDRAVLHIIRAVRPHVMRDGVNAVRVDSNKNPIMGEDGKTPQGIAEVVEEMKVSDGFLFAESSGSGASGGGAANGATGKKRIRRSEIGKYVNEVAAGEVEVVEG